ncbi:MAG TPA: hypothetical protein VNF73_05545, partial [Candidatus Saccharimonadales bacterium]|nr:hypothetical protein [Candidatus Saccharimonadales bacterium]
RTKGRLFLLVTGQGTGSRVGEAARVVAETIRSDYYYDESAGIRVCIRKAIQIANKKVAQMRDRLPMSADGAAGPIGVGLAVVRGNELYVATVGPAEAYLIRHARLSTLPDPHREEGLPTSDLEPEIWRGEISVGDSVVLVSANVIARIGPDELKDAMVTLHPQSAMEHIHHRFIASDGIGSDGAIAFEATEVAATSRQRTLVPVKPPEPLAGSPDGSPIPLADNVADGVAAVQAGAGRARTAAGGWFGRTLAGLQDLLPRRSTPRRRVNPVSARRESQRRAAVAALAFILVVSALGLGVYFFGGPRSEQHIDSVTTAQRAFQAAQADLAAVFGPGVNLVRDDPSKATPLLSDAYQQLATASAAGVPDTTIAPLRNQVTAGLDAIYQVRTVGARVVFTFEKAIPNVDLTDLVQGPDGAPYVLDHTTKTVYRIDVKARKATPVIKLGQIAAGTKAAEPKMLAVGGPDLLILDAKNVLWRWRPADTHGAGTLTRIAVTGSSSWGTDIRAIGTFIRGGADNGLYNLYIVDPPDKQILRYSPAADGSGYPAPPTGFLATAQSLTDVAAMYIDGDVYLAEGGKLARYVGGQSAGWTAGDPGDTLLRPAPQYSQLTSPAARGTGTLYAYDAPNARIVALDKASGTFQEQYRYVGDPGWHDLRGMYVVAGINGDPATLFWIDGKRLYSSVLQAPPGTTGATPSSGSSASGSAGSSPVPSGAAGASGSTPTTNSAAP